MRNLKITVKPIAVSALREVLKSLENGLAELEVGGQIETIQTTTLLRSSRSTEKSPGDLRKLAVTKSLVKHHQRTLVWRTHTEWNKRLINNISHEKTWTWLRKGNFKRETESLQIAAQNNAVRTNHIKARHNRIANVGYAVTEMKPSIT